MIRALYPKADIEGERTKQRTGLLEIKVIRSDGKENLIHSKKGGDGSFKKTNAPDVLQKLRDFVEGQQKKHKMDDTKEQHEKQKEAAYENQFNERSNSKEIVIEMKSKSKQKKQTQNDNENENEDKEKEDKEEKEEKEEREDKEEMKKQISVEQLEEIEQLIKHYRVQLADKQKKEIEELIRQAHMRQNQSESEKQNSQEDSRRSLRSHSNQKPQDENQ